MFELPDTLPTDVNELKALRTQARDAFNSVYGDGENITDENLETMRGLSADMDAINAAIGEAVAAGERSSEAADLAAKFSADTDTEDTDEAEPEAETESVEDTETEPEQDNTTGTEDDEDDTPPDDEAGKEEKDNAVTASGKTRFTGVGTRNPEVPRQEHGFRLTTSAKNYETGVVGVDRVAQEFGNLASGHSARVVAGAGGAASTTFAYLDRETPDNLVIDDAQDVGRTEQAMAFAADESRLNGGSLVAAGGWCAPSETMYDFLPTLAAADLLSLPEVTVTRGGLRFPKEPGFAKIYADFPGFHQTEAQAQANAEKTCVEIPCDDFEEMRLEVIGQCVTSGILQNKAWPEQTAKYIAEVMRAHQHRISAYRIGKVVAGSEKVTMTGFDPAGGAILNAIALQATDIRVKHRIPSQTSLEGFAPVWVRELIRSDMAFQQGVDVKAVTDQQIQDWFAARGINLQFVVDWQDDVIGGEKAPTAWPKTVDIALYPAGTWVSAVEPVINLGITYDHALLKTNKRVELFTEDGVLVGKRGFESRVVSVPISVEGLVGARRAQAGATPAA